MRSLKRLRTWLLAITIGLGMVVVPGVAVHADTTCYGHGTAKTTNLVGSFTSAEVRNTTNWTYSCNYGTILSNPSVSQTVYYNGMFDCTTGGSLSGYPYYSWASSYLYGYTGGDFTAFNSCLPTQNYNFHLYNYVYSSNTSFGAYLRHCWHTGTIISGNSVKCGA